MKTKWTPSEQDMKLFKSLLMTCSPVAHEFELQEMVKDFLKDILCYEQVSTDSLGSVIGQIHPDSDFQILVTAHADEIGMQVVSITAEGMIKFRKLGGIDVHSLYGHHVAILTSDGSRIKGVVQRNPRLVNESEQGYTIRTSELWIDVGAESSEDLKGCINPGDYISFEPDVVELLNGRIVSKGIDDKVGVFCVLKAAQLLMEAGVKIGVSFVTTVQEEIGQRGVMPIVNRVHPNLAFVVDVDYAQDFSQGIGGVVLGRGTVLTMNADNNMKLSNLVRNVADLSNISYQLSIGTSVSGCTDAETIQRAGLGVATLNVSIPCRGMHSHAEICDIHDVISAVNLIVESIVQIDRQQITDFSPSMDSVVIKEIIETEAK